MYDVKSLSTEELGILARAIENEISSRKQHEINQAIDDFEHAFKYLQELRVDVKYYPDSYSSDVIYLRDWDEFKFC